jgi:hypothetical protein
MISSRGLFVRRAAGGPREGFEVESDGGGIESVDGGIEFGEERLLGVETSGFSDEDCTEFFEYPGIAPLIGICESGAENATADAKAVELRRIRGKTGFDIADAVAGGELDENHGEETVVA